MGLVVLGGLGRVACMRSSQDQHIAGRMGPDLTMQDVLHALPELHCMTMCRFSPLHSELVSIAL